MKGHTTTGGILIAILWGVGILSLWQGDHWGWIPIGISILVVALLGRRWLRKEIKK